MLSSNKQVKSEGTIYLRSHKRTLKQKMLNSRWCFDKKPFFLGEPVAEIRNSLVPIGTKICERGLWLSFQLGGRHNGALYSSCRWLIHFLIWEAEEGVGGGGVGFLDGRFCTSFFKV